MSLPDTPVPSPSPQTYAERRAVLARALNVLMLKYPQTIASEVGEVARIDAAEVTDENRSQKIAVYGIINPNDQNVFRKAVASVDGALQKIVGAKAPPPSVVVFNSRNFVVLFYLAKPGSEAQVLKVPIVDDMAAKNFELVSSWRWALAKRTEKFITSPDLISFTESNAGIPQAPHRPGRGYQPQRG